jgi:tetratricopeptide (TPR) repeat protein
LATVEYDLFRRGDLPNHPKIHSKTGELVGSLALVKRLQSAIQLRDRAELVEIVERLVETRSPLGSQWQALANLAAEYGELTLARTAIDLFVEALGGTPAAQFEKARLLMNMGAFREAHNLLCSLPPDVPPSIVYAHTRGAAALYCGETEDARKQLTVATERAPHSGSSWYLLSVAVDLEDEPQLARQLVAAGPVMENASASENAAYHYALGRLHAGREQPDKAIAAFSRASRQMKSWQRYDSSIDRKWAAEAVRGYDGEKIAGFAGLHCEDAPQTIFVTGLPRSGTTLVSQILASHSEVGGGAELGRLPLLAHEIGGQSWPDLKRHLECRDVDYTARLWRHWVAERFPGSERIVDKSVDSSRFLGIIASLLPEAPIIWLTRDPLDCAWSCFRTCFLNIPWTNDLNDIALHFRLENQLLRRWSQILGDRLLVVPYESLVADPAAWIARILRHCGLADEPAAFAPHESPEVMATPSVRQVRRPINRDSVGVAEPYRAFLKPFVEACRA